MAGGGEFGTEGFGLVLGFGEGGTELGDAGLGGGEGGFGGGEGGAEGLGLRGEGFLGGEFFFEGGDEVGGG